DLSGKGCGAQSRSPPVTSPQARAFLPWYTSFVLLPGIDLSHRLRLAEVPVCRPGTERGPQLVIRIEISSKGPPPAPVRRRLSRGALLLIVGAVAVLLSWVGIRVSRPEPASTPAAPRGRQARSLSPKRRHHHHPSAK